MALTSDQVTMLERIIDERKAALLAEIRDEVGRARDETFSALAGPVTDTGDAASADLLADLDNAEITRDLAEIRELDAALARMAEGAYGRCVECGGDIGFDRLRAQPGALRCFACQEVHEKTYSQPPASKL